MIKIKHGIPNHNYFIIVQPLSSYTYGQRIQLDQGKGFVHIELRCPHSGLVIKTELHDILDFHVKEMPRILTYSAYGISPEELELKLLTKYESLKLNPYIEFLLLKKL